MRQASSARLLTAASRNLQHPPQTEAEALALVLACGLARRHSPPNAPVVLVTDNQWFRLEYDNPRKPQLTRWVAACRRLLAGRPAAVAYVPGPRNPADPLSRRDGSGPEDHAGPPLPAGMVAAFRAG
ncbi:hypothetical protein JCM13210_03410 [Thermaerobacter litoralis]